MKSVKKLHNDIVVIIRDEFEFDNENNHNNNNNEKLVLIFMLIWKTRLLWILQNANRSK